MGALLAVIVDLVGYIKELGGEVGECIYRLAQPEGKETLKAVAKLIVDGWRKTKMSLLDMITQCKFDYINSDITEEHFPVSNTGTAASDIELYHPNEYFKDGDEAIAWLRKNKPGFRDATLWELLVYALDKPDDQWKFPIAALGSIWLHASGIRSFAFLGGGGSPRFLNLRRLEHDFDGIWRFAVVREQS